MLLLTTLIALQASASENQKKSNIFDTIRKHLDFTTRHYIPAYSLSTDEDKNTFSLESVLFTAYDHRSNKSENPWPSEYISCEDAVHKKSKITHYKITESSGNVVGYSIDSNLSDGEDLEDHFKQAGYTGKVSTRIRYDLSTIFVKRNEITSEMPDCTVCQKFKEQYNLDGVYTLLTEERKQYYEHPITQSFLFSSDESGAISRPWNVNSVRDIPKHPKLKAHVLECLKKNTARYAGLVGSKGYDRFGGIIIPEDSDSEISDDDLGDLANRLWFSEGSFHEYLFSKHID